MQTRTLRIKKFYFDMIANGEKRMEFRSATPFYEWLRTIETPFLLTLHYQKPPRLTRIVTKVRLIPTPMWIDTKVITTDLCWVLTLE